MAFRMGRLDHVHIRVPDRAEAAAWYREHLGFEPVREFAFWAEGFDGGPLQISADGGETMLALFEVGDAHPLVVQQTGVAFSVDAQTFVGFARSLPGAIHHADGSQLQVDHLIDFDLCWAYDLADPWGNVYELNSYDYDEVRRNLGRHGRSRGQRVLRPRRAALSRFAPHSIGRAPRTRVSVATS